MTDTDSTGPRSWSGSLVALSKGAAVLVVVAGSGSVEEGADTGADVGAEMGAEMGVAPTL